MSRSRPESLEVDSFVCPDCKAELKDDAVACWLCYRVVSHEEMRSAEPPVELNSAGHDALMTLLAVFVVLVVAVGVWDFAPGLGGLLLVIVAPALIVASVRIRRRAQTSGPLSTGQKVAQFAVSAALVLTVVCVLTFAAFIAFFVFCLIALSSGNF